MASSGMRICITNRAVYRKLQELENIMSTVLAGLAQLQQAATEEAAALAANTAATQAVVKAVSDDTTQIANLTAQLAALNTEDPQVAALAAQFTAAAQSLQANTANLTTAVTPAPAATTPAA